MSIAVFAPSDDFARVVDTIVFLRECPSLIKDEYLVKDLATFHIFFHLDHFPTEANIFSQSELEAMKTDCGRQFQLPHKASKSRQKLTYPINVARNLARESASTHFVLASDIELYPNPGLIPDFLAMIRRNDPEIRNQTQKRVFVCPIFEIEADSKMPKTKANLVRMLNDDSAIPFHFWICPACHVIPGQDTWKNEPYEGIMKSFTIGKRLGKQKKWEPIYIGTRQDPLYDERLSREGLADKMTQGYELCALDYDFHVLNGAFLIHKPGMKSKEDNTSQNRKNRKLISAQKKLINSKIIPELKKTVGVRQGCV